MKKSLMLLILFIGIVKSGFCQDPKIEFYNGTPIICGTETKYNDIRVKFNYCDIGNWANCDYSLCNIGNPYKAIVNLYKNGSVFSSHTFELSSMWFNETFTGVSVSSGSTFYATVQFQRKKSFCVGYETIANTTSSVLATPVINGIPNFNVNGNSTPANSTQNVCISNIKLNASATSCETAYNINVQESDQYWNRTYDYEFDVWFAGQAPDNINLQNIASAYSIPPYFTGSAARQGSILLGGNLPSGVARYYRVSLCLGPNWTCKTVLLKVNPACREGQGIEDTNTYTVIQDPNKPESAQTVTSLQDIINIDKDVVVAPNPSNGLFSINMPSMEKTKLEVYDMKGAQVIATEFIADAYEIDLREHPKGIYIVNIVTQSKQYTKKLILE